METIIDANIERDLMAICNLQYVKECLELRLALIGQNNSLKSEFEKNEDDILRVKTQIEIDKFQSIIVQKTFDMNDNFKMLELEYNTNKNG